MRNVWWLQLDISLQLWSQRPDPSLNLRSRLTPPYSTSPWGPSTNFDYPSFGKGAHRRVIHRREMSKTYRHRWPGRMWRSINSTFNYPYSLDSSLASSSPINPFRRYPSRVCQHIVLDNLYNPVADIKKFLQSRFKELKESHPLVIFIPESRPSAAIINWLVQKSLFMLQRLWNTLILPNTGPRNGWMLLSE